MAYLPKGVRELYSYHFNSKRREVVLRFSASQGIISHVKFAPNGSQYASSGTEIIYVQRCKEIVRYNVATKTGKLVGTTSDPIVALHVSSKNLRAFDIDNDGPQNEESKAAGNTDLEAAQPGFHICAVDDGETVYRFDSEMAQPKRGSPQPELLQKIKSAPGVPSGLLRKDLFGMGYPYFVSGYADTIALSTDFGIVVLKKE